MDATELARHCLAEHSVGLEPCLRYWNVEWYRWNGCAYGKISTDAVKKRILAFLHKNNNTSVGRGTVNAVLEMMRLAALVENTTVPCWLSGKTRYPADQMVAAENGLLHLPGLVNGSGGGAGAGGIRVEEPRGCRLAKRRLLAR